MMARHFGCELAFLVILCIVGIFLFPAAAGPYAAVHGPVTALRAARSAAKLRWAMVMAAFGSAGMALSSALGFAWLSTQLEVLVSGLPGRRTLLRC